MLQGCFNGCVVTLVGGVRGCYAKVDSARNYTEFHIGRILVF